MFEMILFGSWVDQFVYYLFDYDVKMFDVIGQVIEGFVVFVEYGLQVILMWLMMVIFIGVGLWWVGWCFVLFIIVLLLLIFVIGFWDQMVIMFGFMLLLMIISFVFGILFGIWVVKSKWVVVIVCLIFDLMQMMLVFVYLILVVMLFGFGCVLGILLMVIFVMLFVVCFMSFGICYVNCEIVEVGQVFGCMLW